MWLARACGACVVLRELYCALVVVGVGQMLLKAAQELSQSSWWPCSLRCSLVVIVAVVVVGVFVVADVAVTTLHPLH